jgi:arylsulfatase A-like enzyme
MSDRPNILLILNDDMGYSDPGCYGGEIRTPALDRLAGGGLRFTQFYNTARCCPSRASLLTGLHPHQADVGHMVGDDGIDGYRGDLSRRAVTIAEALRPFGYRTYMAGKWHVAHSLTEPGNWPNDRGFDDHYGIINGADSYYDPQYLKRNGVTVRAGAGYYHTDALSDEAVRQIKEHGVRYPDRPFFQYLAYTAPHWPLHAHPEDIARYAGRYDAGWDALREERLQRMIELGILDPGSELTARDPSQPPWEEAENKAWQARRMEVYAAQVDRMDGGIARVIAALEETEQLDNTLILFLADNGGCAEELELTWSWLREQTTRDGRPVLGGNDPAVMPGGEDTYQSYGVPWANLSNTPFREYKHWVHEGGIATPLIVHWPAGIADRGALRRAPAQLPDIMATCLDVARAVYPDEYNGQAIQPLEGSSLRPCFAKETKVRETLYWEHEGNAAVRHGRWKLVRKHPGPWELYDMDADRSELHDLAAWHPDKVGELEGLYQDWAKRCHVLPWETLRQQRAQRKEAGK